jgi:hypothetical protein
MSGLRGVIELVQGTLCASVLLLAGLVPFASSATASDWEERQAFREGTREIERERREMRHYLTTDAPQGSSPGGVPGAQHGRGPGDRRRGCPPRPNR